MKTRKSYLLLIALLCVTTDKAGAISFFADEFDGNEVDTTQWTAVERDGNITVSNGTVKLTAPWGKTFPYLDTIFPPFPSSDWKMTLRLRYTAGSSRPHGAGVRGFADGYSDDSLSLFKVWRDNVNPPRGVGGLYFGVVGTQLWLGSKTDTRWHTFEVWQQGDVFSGFIDGEFKGSATSSLRPTNNGLIEIGNNFTTAHNADWNEFEVDYIRIDAVFGPPDLWIKQGGIWLGDDVYNDDGTDQTGHRTVLAGATAVYPARLYNDGNRTETFWIKGPAGDVNWTVQYFLGATEVTAQVTSATGWKRPHVAPGAMRAFSIKVTPGSGVASGQRYAVLVRAESNRDPTQRDVIKTVTRVK